MKMSFVESGFKMTILAIAISSAGLAGCGEGEVSQSEHSSAKSTLPSPIVYPRSEKIDHTDNYHGTSVSDPYRWLEDDVRVSDKVGKWVDAQNSVTNAYLKALPDREKIEARLKALWNYERMGTPFKEGDQYFFLRNDGLQNQSVLYMLDDLEGDPRAVLDPNNWSADGTLALGGLAISPNGRYLAYGIQDGGSDWRTYKIKDLESGEDLDEVLEWLKFTQAAWAADNSGFYYGRYPAPKEGEALQSLNLNKKIYFHRVGTPQSQDQLVYERPDQPDWDLGAEQSEDGRWLVISAARGTDFRNRIFVKDLMSDGEISEIVGDFKAGYSFLGSDNALLYFVTTENAPNRRVVSIDMSEPADNAFREILPEAELAAQSIQFIGNRLIVEYLEDAKSVIKVFAKDGSLERVVQLPGVGSVRSISGDDNEPEAFFSYSSFNTPPAIYRLNVTNGQTEEWKRAEVDFDPQAYEVKQVFFTSKDGAKIPMFIAHKKGIDLTEGAPTLLYGYGGFGISLSPDFSVSRLAWMEMGGVFALANLRGGGEYGEAWHKAGTKLDKQNVFDDFIAAGEYLISQGYTKPKQLAVQGGSNGGLLVGAVINQRPDLFGAALPAVGVMDMLRFHKFTAGRYWVDDYGSSDDPEEFEAILAYSPYHNLSATDYPAVLVTTADRDDRVVPGHSFKYAARIQELHTGQSPVLIRIETRAGHGSGKPTEMIIEEVADKWAFLLHNLEVS